MMSSDDEYYTILHVGGHFLKDTYVRYVDKIFLLTTGEGDVERVEVDGEGDDEWVESDGKGDLEKVESGGEGEIGEVQANKEGVSATSIEVDEDISMESGGHLSLGSTVEEDNDSEVVADKYAGDFATSNRPDNVADGDFATSDGLDNVAAARSGEEEDGNETEVWDSNEHGSLVRSNKDEEHEDSESRRRKFPLYNDKLKSSLANYSPIAKCLQIKTFQDEHYCSVSFKNKMVTVAMIAQHFEAIIKDHPKMKLREIQRSCASEMHVNVTIDCCYRVKKIVKEKKARNHKEEFGLLWNYAYELSSKILLSTDLGLEDGYGYTIISDQQKIVKCTAEREWEDLCLALEKKDNDAYDNLMKKSPKMWTKG
ncbi:hypothetical protein J1N35_011837 [Gossypium stocksii]|uniref:Uncharacterized protein n=1 Tax=Gossypium stocksii TaxID=47602 RepID=A0A9D3W2S8_9ROSI|nr:hypothetical protein J1N35_011837 [Gossypium stocksii]